MKNCIEERFGFEWTVFGALDDQSGPEDMQRRLSCKVSDPPGYLPAGVQILFGPQHEQKPSMKSNDSLFFQEPTILADTKEIIPRVGMVVFLEKGPLFDRIQEPAKIM